MILSCMVMNNEQMIPYGLSKIVQRTPHANMLDLKICVRKAVCFPVTACSPFLSKDTEDNLSSKQLGPLPIFTASDIIQVVPSYSVPLGLQYRDIKRGGEFKPT